jgi:hypothetical protein
MHMIQEIIIVAKNVPCGGTKCGQESDRGPVGGVLAGYVSVENMSFF